MLRFRQFRGLHLAIALFLFNAIVFSYLHFFENLDPTNFWPLAKKGPEESSQLQVNQLQKTNSTKALHQDSENHTHAQSQNPTHDQLRIQVAEPISTVFVTPKPKIATVMKSTTVTVTTTSPKISTVTELQTQIVEVAAKPPPPQETLGPRFCKVCGPHDVYCHQYGEHNLAKARTYEGSNARFRRVLRKALAGQPILVGVLGGSVTKGHGLTNPDQNWTFKLLDQLRMLLPMSEIELVNGAVPATGTDYFSMCFQVHIPEDVDLVIIELSINDQRIEPNAIAYEWLLRGLLNLPKRPAILNIQIMALAFEAITLGGDLHTPIAQFYDTPIINLRNMLLPHILKDVSLDEHYFYVYDDGKVDFRHVSVHGHKIMADLLSAYTQRQLCAIEEEKVRPNTFVSDNGKLPNFDDMEDIPRLRLFDKYSRTKEVGSIRPSCRSVRTRNHYLAPIETKGWEVWTYKGDMEKPYLRADKVGDYVKFEVQVGVMGRVRITYLRSKVFGLGDVLCWIDNDREHGTRIVSWWQYEQYNLARVEVVAENVKPGNHNLTCEIIPETTDPDGGHEFRLIAVDSA